MKPPQTANALLELIEKSGLIDARRLGAADQRYSLRRRPVEDSAKVLIKLGLINRFHASQLLKGRHRGFFIDGYKLLGILGAGGMGLVYVAEDPESREQVALKVLFESCEDDSGMLARFEFEAEAGLRLNHPNIVRTYKLNNTEGAYYVVMEYVKGITLYELVRTRGRLPWQQACDLAAQAASGLQHVHNAGMVHRDLKPANLLIDATGTAKILDFGLSLLDFDQDEQSLSMLFGHDRLGTADYVAPEQAEDSLAVDCRADIYSLGCTLYFSLTGDVPFPIKSVSQRLEAHKTKKAPDLQEKAPDVPDKVAKIVRKMMAKRPDHRFQTADEIHEVLAPLGQRQPVRFDFKTLLIGRSAGAKKRIAEMEEKKKRRRLDASSSAISTGSFGTTTVLFDPSSASRLNAVPETGVLEIRDVSGTNVLCEIDRSHLPAVQLPDTRLTKADLKNFNLCGANFSKSNLDFAQFEHARLTGVKFNGASLVGVQMVEVEVSHADLANACFNEADMRRAKLGGSDLRNAHLQNADLSGADLKRADLSMANLTGADLSGADLVGANLRGANLTSASLSRANLERANLSGAILDGTSLVGIKVHQTIGPTGQPLTAPGKKRTAHWWQVWK